MDRITRNSIERATQQARKLLEEDFGAQLAGDFDVHRNGAVAAKAGSHLSARQAFQRERIIVAIQHKRAAGMNAADSVADYLRDAAFTTLNRFVALKMLEARELMQECITKGEQSAGYREFCGMAPGLPLLPESAGYRLYIESLFDELSTEVKVLFDRRDPSSVLWPKRATFEQLLEILNADELARVWGEDETIGWVYQFFNREVEREAARYDEHGNPKAPQNSRELAVRNQFFTPRYVVQFLTDNTLARIWYEMRGTKTALAEKCVYLVRKPGEQSGPRAKKDPRDLRVLDPACGSGHFLLYAFDLLLVIYEEAFSDSESPGSEVTGRALAADYSNLEALRKALPGLILAHNLHGVDIDARCVQIAQLALWMRAQRAFRDIGIPRAERPAIRRTNIIAAEPLVADERLTAAFVARLEDMELGRVFQGLVDSLKPAADLGLLLRVETLIARPLARGKSGNLFAAPQERLRAMLGRFAAEEGQRTSTACRLFTHDAAQGLRLLSLAEIQYDVVLMNPPFGAEPTAASRYVRKEYPVGYVDLACAFVDRALMLTASDGCVGAIVTRTPLFLSSFEAWRRATLLAPKSQVYAAADLGVGVLDAMVETAAITVAKAGTSEAAAFIDCRQHTDKATVLQNAIRSSTWHILDRADAARLPSAALAYWSGELLNEFSRLPPLKDLAEFFVTSRTGDDPRFVRAFWEVVPESLADAPKRRWRRLSKGGAYCAFYTPIDLVVDWRDDGGLLGESLYLRRPREGYCWGPKSRTHSFMGTPGLIWSSRSQKGLSFRVLPRDCATTNKSLLLTSRDPDRDLGLLVLLNRYRTQHLAQCMTTFGAYERGTIEQVPVDPAEADRWGSTGRACFLAARRIAALVETDPNHPILCNKEDIDPNSMLRRLRNGAQTDLRVLVGALRDDTDEPRTDDRIRDLEDIAANISSEDIAFELLGFAFGHWDVEQATTSRVTNDADPFASLPLRQPARVPLSRQAVDSERIDILADDEGTPHDIVQRIHEVSDRIWGEASDSFLESLSRDLKGLALRNWLRQFAFPAHLKRYTTSRRTAPLYWQLATISASYSVWVYVHAFTRDTFFRIQTDYATPKLAHEERRLASITSELREGATAAQRKHLAAQEALVEELRAFLDEVKRIAPLWNPNLDDGVIINFAPLWRLVPHNKGWQKDLKATWDSLCAGEFDWAHLAMHLWPDRVVRKCAKDRSLAIAHGLNDLFWVEDSDGKWAARKTPAKSVEELVKERTSPAVKSALKSLLEAPVASGKSSGRKGRGRRKTADVAEGGEA